MVRKCTNPTSGDLGILLMVSHGSSCFQNPLLESFYINSSLQDCSEQGIKEYREEGEAYSSHNSNQEHELPWDTLNINA